MPRFAANIIPFVFATAISSSLIAQKKVQLKSPDGNISYSFMLIDKKGVYSVSYKNKIIISNSDFSLIFSDAAFKDNLTMDKPLFHDGEDNYELVVGKTKTVHDYYKEMVIPLQESSSKKINLIVRAFNDGLAFRYEFPKQENWSDIVLTDERNTFHLVGNPGVHALLLPDYTTSHEGRYCNLPLSNLREDTLMDLPALFELPEKIYLGITEAELVDYAGMYLIKHDGILRSLLSPLPHQTEVKVKASLPHFSPWRVLLISDRIGALIESNIITDLNEPCKIKDLSWIKPGKTTWPWWNGNVVPDTINAPGNNFVTQKYYIDFCARNGIEYHSVVEYGLHQWYMDDGIPFSPGPHSDVTTPVPGLDMKEVCDYAKSKGVGIRVWVHWAALYPKIDTAF
ncbi:MAG TPA: glycoside hydrolase family 97 N-terminal domain-containing protein, partial [Puia sp.]|nr:glycoside hydrolase family 97 N-terminal domain-containing protein [Puia sp.]